MKAALYNNYFWTDVFDFIIWTNTQEWQLFTNLTVPCWHRSDLLGKWEYELSTETLQKNLMGFNY